MTGIRFPITLSESTFAFTWACADGVEDMPVALFTDAIGHTAEERARVEARAFAEITALSGGPRNHEAFLFHLEQVYGVLARPEVEYFGLINRLDGTQYGALVACTDQRAYGAMLDRGEVTINTVRPAAAAEAFVSVLKEYPPARFHPVSARVNEVWDNPCRDGEAPAPTTRHRNPDAVFLRRLIGSLPESCEPRSELYVARRDRNGRRRQCTYPLWYMVHDDGWVLFHTSPDGTHVTAMPATREVIAARMNQLLDEL